MMRRLLKLWWCRLFHAPLLEMTDGRIWLRCPSCGVDTDSPGITWRITPTSHRNVLRFRRRLRAANR